MNRLLLIAALLYAPVPSLAEEPARTDLFFGPSLVHTDFASRSSHDEQNPFGGAVAWTGYPTGFFGIVLDGSLHYRSHEGPELRASARELNLGLGPRFAFNRAGSASFFIQALFGLRSDRASISFLDTSYSDCRTRFGMAFGGGVDVRVSPRWAVRLQGDYLYSRLGDVTQNGFLLYPAETVDGFRISVGAVYRSGSAAPKQP